MFCFCPISYIKVHMATRWTIRHGLMLLWFTDLMNVTKEVTIHKEVTIINVGSRNCNFFSYIH